MAFPFILIGAAVLAGGYGVKKGLDAKEDFNRAEELNNEAREIYDNAKESLEKECKKTQLCLESLGKQKLSMYEACMIPFAKSFAKIKNIDFKDKRVSEKFNTLGLSTEKLLEVQEVACKMEEVVGGGVAALGAGGLTGLAVYGSIPLLGAVASTGTAIGTLSGVAATNATLAWLGGGSLAAGGFGMAGGMAVLGGVVAGPVLAVGGMMLASKAEAARETAYANRDKARLAAEEMKNANAKTHAIALRINELKSVLQKLSEYFRPLLRTLETLTESSRSHQWDDFSETQQEQILVCANMACFIKDLLDTPLLTEEGTLTQASQVAIEQADQKIASY